MNSINLTARGKEILASNTTNGGQTYWVGYFGLAYVPSPSEFDEDCTTLIRKAASAGEESEESDETGESTGEVGDYIYNIWQGDLINEGHSIATGNFSRLTLYDRNLTSNFRYVYDKENSRNRLATWTTDDNGDETSSYVRTGYKVYNGVTLGDGNNSNDVVDADKNVLPCPAPLFYAGSACTYGANISTPDDLLGQVGKDWPISGDGPFVTPDMRSYLGTITETGSAWNWHPSASQYDTLPSEYTRIPCDGTNGKADGLDQYAKFVSVSIFNKEHGHVSSEGYGVDLQASCHNMSTVTKLFPIARYEIESTGDSSTDDPNYSERGSVKSIKYNIRLNLREAYQGVQNYIDMLNYKGGDVDGTVPNSFKFNRIGIYAVPVTIRHFYKEGDAGNRSDCRATHYQVEISPDAIPELFAVMNVDEVCMSEDGSFGLNDYNTTFILNLESTGESSGLCTNPEVYYNLVENEAITWYQNQLLATAGLSEAVTNLGVNVAHLMSNMNRGQTATCCSGGSSVTNVRNTYIGDMGGKASRAQIIEWEGNETRESAEYVWTRAQEILANDLCPVIGLSSSNGYMKLIHLVHIDINCVMSFYDHVDNKYYRIGEFETTAEPAPSVETETPAEPGETEAPAESESSVDSTDPVTTRAYGWKTEWANVGEIEAPDLTTTPVTGGDFVFKKVSDCVKNGYYPKLRVNNGYSGSDTIWIQGELTYVTQKPDTDDTKYGMFQWDFSVNGVFNGSVSLSDSGAWNKFNWS